MTDNRLLKRRTVFYALLFWLFCAVDAFMLWNAVYNLCNMLGSWLSGASDIARIQLTRMLPQFLMVITWTWLGFGINRAQMAKDAPTRSAFWRDSGIITILLALLTLAYILFCYATGIIDRITETAISRFYPLDTMLCAVVILFYGFFQIIYGINIKQNGDVLQNHPHPQKGIVSVFGYLGYLNALAGLAATAYAPFLMDWRHGYIFYNVMLVLNYFAAFYQMAVYRMLCTVKNGQFRKHHQWKYSLGLFCLNLVLFGLYLLAAYLQQEAPDQNAAGLLPVEHTSGRNLFPMLFGCNNLLGPLGGLLNGLRKKPKKAR